MTLEWVKVSPPPRNLDGKEPITPSPFPGMDPYLEGRLWTTVHFSLSAEFVRQLAPKLRPRYLVLPAERFVYGDARKRRNQRNGYISRRRCDENSIHGGGLSGDDSRSCAFGARDHYSYAHSPRDG